MLSISSKLLIIILALLQLVAPLVHAHTHEEDSKQGFHLPELEILSIHYNEPSLHTEHPHNHDCSIINLKQGIKNNKKSDGAISLPILFLGYFLFKTEDNYSPHYNPVFRNPPLSRISLIRIFPTRAPPSAIS